MMYSSGIVAVVKSNGKILRENKDEVYLPFGSEYSILLKNLETKRCRVIISIDGQDVLDGNALIIEPNTETELKGFMKGSAAKNRFKFIKKTKEISDFRGDRVDDGIIRVEYWFEKVYEKKHLITEHIYHHHYYDNCNYNCRWCSNWSCPKRHCTQNTWFSSLNSSSLGNIGSSISGTTSGSSSGSSSPNVSSTINDCSVYTCSLGSISNSYTENQVQDEGITVKGNEINQQFIAANIGDLEEHSRVIILRLIGTSGDGKIVEKPLTVKTKKQCKTCGKKSKSHIKYCPNCGTFLE